MSGFYIKCKAGLKWVNPEEENSKSNQPDWNGELFPCQ